MAHPFQQRSNSSNGSRHPLSQSRKRPAENHDIGRRFHPLEEGHSYLRNNHKRVHLVSFDWREDGRVDAVRAKMIEQLQQQLKEQTKALTNDHATMAKVMEKILFQQATSLEDYLKGCRNHNLEQHLKLAAARLLERKLQKADAYVQVKAQSRRTALVQALGGDKAKFHQVESLVHLIKLLRTGATVQQHVSPSPSFRTTIVVEDDDDLQSSSLPSDDCPVRALYFGTPLVTAFDLSPIEDLSGLCWDQLMSAAEHNVREYGVWMMKNASQSHHPQDES